MPVVRPPGPGFITFVDSNPTELLSNLLPTDVSLYINRFKGNLPQLPETVRNLKIATLTGYIEGLPTHLEGLEIQNASADVVTRLFPFPPTLTHLTLFKCGLTEFPPLPEGLLELNLAMNRIQEIPETLPRGLTMLALLWNPIQTIPRLPLSLEVITLEGDPLIEPYQSFYNDYVMGVVGEDENAMDQLKEKINLYTDLLELKERYKQLLTYKQGLVVKPENRRNQNSSSSITLGTVPRPNRPGTQTYIHPGLPNVIGSYFTGIEGPTVNQQAQIIRQKIQNLRARVATLGGRRKTRRGRKFLKRK